MRCGFKFVCLVLMSCFCVTSFAQKTGRRSLKVAYANSESVAIRRYEKATLDENYNIRSRSFSSPTKVDTKLKVKGITEKVKWLSASAPDLSSPLCKKGGTWKSCLFEYPSTFRIFGPESNVSTRSLMASNPGLVGISAETREFYVAVATHWAFSNDGKAVYFKLREDLKWSDGVPCTADDLCFLI